MPDLYQISTEELALAMSMVGASQNAKALLETTFGSLSKDEAHGRLMAAGDSLAARSLLTVEGGEDAVLDHRLNHIVQVLLTPAFTLKYDKGLQGELQTLAYHFARDSVTIIEHIVHEGVAHQLSRVEKSTAIERGIDFFAVPQKDLVEIKAVTVPLALFNDVRARALRQPTTARTLMEKAGWAPEHARLLIEDLRTNKYQGSVMRVEYKSDSRPFSEQGFLTLQSDERTWILSISLEQGGAFITPTLASADAFQSQVQELIR